MNVPARKTVKLDRINRRILATLHRRADLTNVELAEIVGLSPSACFQRTKALKDAGYIFNFMAEVDLARICPRHVLAYVEFTLASNTPAARKRFARAVNDVPEIMDCMRVTGATDYVALCCFPDLDAATRLCDELGARKELGIARVTTRVILERAKWYLGYPIASLGWQEDPQSDSTP